MNRNTVIVSMIENSKELELMNVLNIRNRYEGLSGKKCIEFKRILACSTTRRRRRKRKEVGKISSSVRRFKNGSVVIATRNICTKGKRKYST